MEDVELVARYIAARKMGLVKDVYGIHLLDDLWIRYQDMARGLLKLNHTKDVLDIVELTIQPA
jgi:hypothetical protein